MAEALPDISELESCPKCSSKLPPRFSTGRVVCSKCGWTNQPKSNSVQNLTLEKGEILAPNLAFQSSLVKFIKTKNGERALIATGSFIVASILWLGISSSNTKKTELGSGSQQSTSIATDSASPSVGEWIKTQVTNSYSIQGDLTLIDSRLSGTADNCYGSGGYSDIEAAMPVTVKDGTGKIIATGNTSAGSQPSGSEFGGVECIFAFKIENVPKVDFYSIEIGRRGALNYSFNEIQKRNWKVALSLGT
jgi:hypothetical protein